MRAPRSLRSSSSRRAYPRSSLRCLLCFAFLRMRTSIRVKLPIHFSHSPPRSRGAFLRPGFAFWLRAPEKKGGGAPRDVPVLARHPLGLHITRQARRLARRLASHNAGRPPLGAPPWRFWAPVPRFLLRHLLRIRSASSSQPGRSAWRAIVRLAFQTFDAAADLLFTAE